MLLQHNVVCVIQLTGVDAGARGRDAELRLDELGDEGDECGDYGAFCRVGEADEQEGHVAQDPHCCFGQVCRRRREERVLFVVYCKEVICS